VRFDKSLKVLNYAKDNLGFVELYTELDHSFVAGDRVFIVGGHYDNTHTLNYITSYNNLTPAAHNPFAQHKNGYLVRSVNYSQNSFVIDVPSTPTLFYPYGVVNNIIGDPQDAVNLAYNHYPNNLYKGVYVSRTSFINGRFKKGTINNGIFGNDYHTIHTNIHNSQAILAVQSDVSITHVAAKNMSISKVVISSKTDSQNPSSIKFKVVEDNTINPGPNPFTVASITVGPNNNTWGYSSYERFKIYESSEILNGDFNNPRSGFIEIINTSITRAKFGGKEPIDVVANVITNGAVRTGFLGNYTNQLLYGISNFDGGVIDTFIDLKATNATWGAFPGDIEFDVDYDVVANKKWTGPYFVSGCYVSGITPILPNTVPLSFNDNSLRYDITQTWAGLNGATYTHGVINSAKITLYFGSLVPNWAAFTTNFTPADFDFSKMKITFQTMDNMWINGNTQVSTAIMSFGNTYIEGNGVVIKEGFYDRLLFDANTQFEGTSAGESILLLNAAQMFQSDTAVNPVFNWVTVQYATTPIKGSFNNSKIYSAKIHNSTMENTFVSEYTSPIAQYFGYIDPPNIYLYNTIMSGDTRVDATIRWDYVQFDGNLDTVGYDLMSNAYVLEHSKFGQRKTPWKTGPTAIAPLSPLDTVAELNKKEGIRSLLLYNSQTEVTLPNLFPLPIPPVRSLFYHAPSLENIQTIIDTSKYMSVIDHGDMYQNPGFSFLWFPDNSKKRSDVLFANILDYPDIATIQLKTRILDRVGHNLSGFTFHFTGVDPLIASLTDIREVDSNFEYEYQGYFNDNRPRELSDITLNVYENPDVQPGQPDPAYPYNNIPFIKITDLFLLTSIDGITPGTIAVPDGNYSLNFRHLGPTEQQCIILPGPIVFCYATNTAQVPACYIEVERVIVKYYNALNDLKDVVIHNCNYCPPVPGFPGVEYSNDYLVTGSAYPQDFPMLKSPYNPTDIIDIFKFTGDPMFDHAVVEVEYWVTSYFAQPTYLPTIDNMPFSGFTGGHRAKKIDVYTFV
jgi:hypothetical protein